MKLQHSLKNQAFSHLTPNLEDARKQITDNQGLANLSFTVGFIDLITMSKEAFLLIDAKPEKWQQFYECGLTVDLISTYDINLIKLLLASEDIFFRKSMWQQEGPIPFNKFSYQNWDTCCKLFQEHFNFHIQMPSKL